ncbi:tripartite tricarboxylate transporter TctB family protein [Comamonas sp. GB3 AK4-5]|uniref:tripartite tricarboxylate transporter TctB family protein n=1 Tax=Comamonas sp. GB3 AK4-5 TaxID=3231487 RepID=UPI00351DB152
MLDRDIRDILAGLFVSTVGIYFALVGSEYTFGTAGRMGPGYIPVVLGCILVVLGIFIMTPAFFRKGESIEVHWDSLIASLLSLVVFAFALNIMGVFFSTMIAVLIASVPKPMHLIKRFMIAAVIAVVTSVIFVIGLDMTISMFPEF